MSNILGGQTHPSPSFRKPSSCVCNFSDSCLFLPLDLGNWYVLVSCCFEALSERAHKTVNECHIFA